MSTTTYTTDAIAPYHRDAPSWTFDSSNRTGHDCEQSSTTPKKCLERNQTGHDCEQSSPSTTPKKRLERIDGYYGPTSSSDSVPPCKQC
mmetsp:Transcript_5914/g.12918  ORF Transcript_5914/g.12918 Transcript_5914/m.12918 type:complete len:89 (-) Transcript_5914:2106-2372(-)